MLQCSGLAARREGLPVREDVVGQNGAWVQLRAGAGFDGFQGGTWGFKRAFGEYHFGNSWAGEHGSVINMPPTWVRFASSLGPMPEAWVLNC